MSSVLVVGSGGREHALAWKLSLSTKVDRLVLAPGNDGVPADWERWPADLWRGREVFESLAKRARGERIDLAVIGPDNALAGGIVDVFEEAGVPVFGPSSAAAQIEASKIFSKEVMQAAHVPTARFFVAGSREEARKILKSVPWPLGGGWVVKADGLALGKGVRVCGTYDEAVDAADSLIAISGKLVIEEKLQGEELTWMAFCDGTRCALLEPARDYKRLSDGDRGPNTGGMGAFSPVPGIPTAWEKRVCDEVFTPVLREMRARGRPFKGLLYAGLMADVGAGKFWVVEFNSRFGDPEAQVVLPRMDDDLFDWCMACARGDLTSLPVKVRFKRMAAVAVVAASQGYPDKPERGKRLSIANVAETDLPRYFFAGVATEEGELVTSGGRVLAALGVSGSLPEARDRAYENLGRVQFPGMIFRHDIAQGVRS